MKRTNKSAIFLIIAGFLMFSGVSYAEKRQKPYIRPTEDEEVEKQEYEKDKITGEEQVSTQETEEKEPEEIKPVETAVEEDKKEPEVEQEPEVKEEPQSEQSPVVVREVEGTPVEIIPRAGNSVSVILMIANGMGASLYGIVRQYRQIIEEKSLCMEQVMNAGTTGYLITQSADYIVSDNAAAASAIATGYKVNNGVISITPEGKKPETILERMQGLGMSVGVITTCEVTDSLTAAFTVHAENEDKKETIALQQLNKNLDVIMGGGFKWFDAGNRSDGIDLIQRAQKMNYTIVTSRNELSKIRAEDTGKIIGLFADRMLDFSVKENKNQPTLAHMVNVALGVLKKNEKGFFLLVEGGRIAHAAHGNLTKEVINEVLSFDDAVREVLEYMQSDPEVLLVITANVEVGCPVISKKNWGDKYMKDNDMGGIFKKDSGLVMWQTQHHTATPVPVFAVGPGSEKVAGIQDNTCMFKIMKTERQVHKEPEQETEQVREVPRRRKPSGRRNRRR